MADPIVVRLKLPYRNYPVGAEFGFKDVADALRIFGSADNFDVVREQDGDPITPPTDEDWDEATREAIARARAARLIRGGEFDTIVPPDGHVIVGSADGPVARDVSEIGGDPNAVIGMGVKRIVTSFDPNHPLEDGDLLVLLEPQSLFMDFTDPVLTNWSKPWATASATYSIVDDAGAGGGKLLRAVTTSAARHPFAFGGDALRSADQEIVVKWRTTATTTNPRFVLRGSGTAGAETGYFAGRSGVTTLTAGRYTNGPYNEDASAIPVVTLTANTWYITRFRINTGEGRYAYREWLASEPEPSPWNFERPTVAAISGPGFIGLMPFSASTVEYDWIGMSFYGGTAPMTAGGV